jgi:hypothetical protein
LRTNRISAWKNKRKFAVSEAEKVDKKNNKNCTRSGLVRGKIKPKFAINKRKKLIKNNKNCARIGVARGKIKPKFAISEAVNS